MIEIYKHLHELSSKLMTEIFNVQKNPWSVHFRVDAIAFCATQLWEKVSITVKDFL